MALLTRKYSPRQLQRAARVSWVMPGDEGGFVLYTLLAVSSTKPTRSGSESAPLRTSWLWQSYKDGPRRRLCL